MTGIDAVRFAASVFSREAIRASRRWQTWVQRAAFAAVLLAWISSSLILTFDPHVDPSEGGTLGWRLFQGYAYAQIMLVVLFTPLIVGQGLIEERDESTLGLLALTRLSARQILWGKVGSRLLVLGSWVLASMPILAACTTFGGVGPWDVVNVVVNTLLLLLVLGLMGGLVALIVDGTLAIGIVVGSWAVGALVIVPVFFGGLVGTWGGSSPPPQIGYLSPLFAPVAGDYTGLFPVLATLPIVFVATRWAGPLFAAAIADPDARRGPAGLDQARTPEARELETRVRRAGWGALLVTLTLPFVVIAIWLDRHAMFSVTFDPTLLLALSGAWTVAFVASATGLLVLLLLRIAELRRRFGRLHLGTLGSLPFNPFRLFRGRVWFHPVAWREVVTNAWGASTVIARWGVPLWLGGMLTVTAPMNSGEVTTLLQWTGFLLGYGLSMYLAAETIAAERRQRTLELLSISTMRSLSLVTAKIVAVGALAGPYLVIASALFLADMAWSYEIWPATDLDIQWRRAYCGEWSIAWGDRSLRVAVTAAWLVATWGACITASMLGSMWVHQPRQAWIVNLALVAAVLVVPIAAEAVLPGEASRSLQSLVYPLDGSFSDPYCGTSPWMFGSTLVYALAACGLFVACAASIRLVVRRDAR